MVSDCSEHSLPISRDRNSDSRMVANLVLSQRPCSKQLYSHRLRLICKKTGHKATSVDYRSNTRKTPRKANSEGKVSDKRPSCMFPTFSFSPSHLFPVCSPCNRRTVSWYSICRGGDSATKQPHLHHPPQPLWGI